MLIMNATKFLYGVWILEVPLAFALPTCGSRSLLPRGVGGIGF
jgi:hypothetical protein